MTPLKILAAAFLITSCNGISQTKQNASTNTEDWETLSKVTSAHSYNKNGLLDTTYSTQYIYVQGMLMDTVKSITVRKYDDQNNLISENRFDAEHDKIGELRSETTQKFDERKNVIYFLSKSKGVNYDQSYSTYNSKNQLIKSVNIYQKMKDTGEKPVKGSNSSSFDTTVNTYHYDENGNQIKLTSAAANGNVKSNRITIYRGAEKQLTYQLNQNGDTTITFTYFKEQDLTKEVVKAGPDDETITWSKNDKVIKVVSKNDRFHINTKNEIKYNDKGDAIEDITYKLVSQPR